MTTIKFNMFGIGSVRISTPQKIVYVDTFAEQVKPVTPDQVDLILITHNDGDHFLPSRVAEVATEMKAQVIGPPGIAYPLLADEKLLPEQLQIIYPVHFKKPVSEESAGVKLKVYQTKHFVDWEPDHISFLLEIEGKRIYIAGDSYMLDEADPDMHNLDAIFYSLVGKDVDDPASVTEYLAQLEEVLNTFNPKHLFPNHLIDCDWTINASDLKKAAEEKGLSSRIVVIENREQTFELA